MLPFASAMMMAGAGGAAAAPNVADVFKVQLYTGNATPRTITTGIAADLVSIKSRSATQQWGVFDTSRGANKILYYAATAPEDVTVGPPDDLSAFTGTGFEIGAGNNVGVNNNTLTYGSWSYKKAPRFFDSVTWTGNGANRTIPHSLGIAPGFIRVKRRDTTGAWRLWHKDLTSAAYGIQMSAGEASEPTLWNSTAPDTAVFSLGTHNDVNASGGTYVAQLYAHDTAPDGIIQCGIFTTDGSGNATVSGLPFQPQLGLFAYRNAATPFWTLADTTRGWGVGGDAYFFESTSDAEASGGDFGGPTSDGFTITGFTPSTATLYMAIAAP